MKYLLFLNIVLVSCGRPDPLEALPQFHFPEAPTAVVPDQMVDYSRKAIQLCAPGRFSEAAGEVLAQDVSRVATEVFRSNEKEAEAFVAMLCIESQFDQSAKSPVGAVGVSQLMPQYLQDFSKDCGLGRVVPKDIEQLAINLRLGACHFRAVLNSVGGNIPLALASYNAGSNSRTLANLRKGGTGAKETSDYIARHYVVTEKLRGEEKK